MSSGNLYINGKWVQGKGPELESVNPYSGETLWRGNQADGADIAAAVKAARKALAGWSGLPVDERIAVLRKFTQNFSDKKNELALLISQETGKPLWESLTEVQAAVAKLDISIAAFHDRCRELKGDIAGATRITRFRPNGAVAVFGPFNFPFHLPNGHIIPALIAGNTIIFKPSDKTPSVGEFTAVLWEEAGLPEGVLNLIQGAAAAGRMLVTAEDIDGIFFTGSAAVGKQIHKSLGGFPEKILALEMGGNNPLIVWDVEDQQAAALLTIQSAFITSGQRCVCARRLIIPADKRGASFLEILADRVGKIKIGPYTQNPEPFMGPVISPEAASSIVKVQEQLSAAEGTILSKVEIQNEQKTLLSCGLIDVTDVSVRADAECFGPLLQVIRVRDFNQAVIEANNTSFGLSAGLLSDKADHYNQFLKQSKAGIINWNRQITGASSENPFGGTGASGNFRPSAYFAADYCAHPVASIESNALCMPKTLPPGL